MAQQNRRERKKEETRKRILSSAFKLFVDNGFEATTIDQIAEAADIGKGTFYNYFPSKEAALEGFIDEIAVLRGQKIWPDVLNAPDTRQRLAKSYQSVTSWSEKYPDLIKIYAFERTKAMLKKEGKYQYNKSDLYFAEVIKMGQAAGDIRDDIDALQLISYLNSIFFVQICKWLESGAGKGLYELTMQGVDFFLIGAFSIDKD